MFSQRATNCRQGPAQYVSEPDVFSFFFFPVLFLLWISMANMFIHITIDRDKLLEQEFWGAQKFRVTFMRTDRQVVVETCLCSFMKSVLDEAEKKMTREGNL